MLASILFIFHYNSFFLLLPMAFYCCHGTYMLSIPHRPWPATLSERVFSLLCSCLHLYYLFFVITPFFYCCQGRCHGTRQFNIRHGRYNALLTSVSLLCSSYIQGSPRPYKIQKASTTILKTWRCRQGQSLCSHSGYAPEFMLIDVQRCTV